VVLHESSASQPVVIGEGLFCRNGKSDANSCECFALESFAVRSSPLEALYFTQNHLATVAMAKTFHTQCRLVETLKAASMPRTEAFSPVGHQAHR
jgi:hypothetical protein